jgi:hypothetical protein
VSLYCYRNWYLTSLEPQAPLSTQYASASCSSPLPLSCLEWDWLIRSLKCQPVGATLGADLRVASNIKFRPRTTAIQGKFVTSPMTVVLSSRSCDLASPVMRPLMCIRSPLLSFQASGCIKTSFQNLQGILRGRILTIASGCWGDFDCSDKCSCSLFRSVGGRWYESDGSVDFAITYQHPPTTTYTPFPFTKPLLYPPELHAPAE